MSFVLPDPFPPAWASEWEEDSEWGLAATLNLKGVKQTFRWIQPGTFLMGSPEGEVDREKDETQHQVTLTRGYWLADTACTQALWRAVMGDDPSRFKDDATNPVEQVSWDDVQTFLKRLNVLVPGFDSGLPSDAQWEHSCRAGTSTPVLVRREHHAGAGKLPRQLPLRGWQEGLISGAYRPGQIPPPQPVGALRDARQRVRVVRRLVRCLSRGAADRPGRPAGGRRPRVARRVLVRLRSGLPRCLPRLGRAGLPPPLHWLPPCPSSKVRPAGQEAAQRADQAAGSDAGG